MIDAQGIVTVNVGISTVYYKGIQLASNPGTFEGSCSAAQNPMHIETYCTTWNGFADKPFAPSDPIRTRVEISWVGGRPLVSAYGTFFPSLEVWFYGAAGPQLIYFYNAMGLGLPALRPPFGQLPNSVGSYPK